MLTSGSLFNLFVCLHLAVFGLCAVDVTHPESGSIIVGAENKANITLFCVSSGTLHGVIWSFIDEGAELSTLTSITTSTPGFLFDGVDITNTTIPFATNLTILELTEDFDRKIIFCGVPGNLLAANFSLRIYRPPSFVNITQSSLIELASPNSASVISTPPAFPTPQFFQWTRDGVVQDNNFRLTFAYETVTFNPVHRTDAGTYVLTASNYECEEEILSPPNFNCTPSTVMIGSDMGSLNLEVLLGPGIDSTEVQFAAGVGGSVTLKCGVNLTGNPTPTIAWRDNTAAFINQSGGRYTFSSAGLQLTVYNVTVADDGNWTCVLTVTNPATAMPIGVSEELRQLTVILPPDAPLNLSVVDGGVLSTAVLLEWATPSNDTVPKVTEYRIVSLDASINVSTGSDTSQYNVTDLLPSTEYSFTVAGVVTLLGVSEVGPPSEAVNVTTPTSEPSVMAAGAPISSGGVVTVSWSYAHTGGLPLTRVLVQYQSVPDGMLMTAPGGDVANPLSSFTSLAVEGPVTGEEYQFRVTASNVEGSDVIVLPIFKHTVGIPARPEVPANIFSNRPGQATLSLSTSSAGLSSTTDLLTFTVTAFPTNGTPKTQTMVYERYTNQQVVVFVFTGLEPGMTYVFTVMTRNQFGVSEASGNSELLTIQSKDCGTDCIVGAAVGGTVAVAILIASVVLVVVCIRQNHKRSSSKQSGSKDESYVNLSPQAVPSADTQTNVAYGQVESCLALDDGDYMTISPQTVDTQANMTYGQVVPAPDADEYAITTISPQAVPSVDTQANVAYGQVESCLAPDNGEYVITTISPQAVDTQANVACGQVESCLALGMEAAI